MTELAVLDPAIGFVDEPIDPALDLFEEIERLKEEKNAVLLAHYYQEADIQDIADYIGDSLGLSRRAAETDAEVIVFAGVHFMAETAKILNPTKKVLLPDLNAGCSLADACPADDFAAFKARYPDHVVVSYINCTAATKALSDVICTSSNAEHIIRQIPESQGIIFAPDKNLGRYLMKETGREMVLWDGVCIVHETFSEEKLVRLKVRHPGAPVLAHPECEEAVLRHADFIGSTSNIRRYARESERSTFIVATEEGIPPPDAEGQPREDVHPRPARERLRLQPVPAHAAEHDRESCTSASSTRSPRSRWTRTSARRALRPIERMLEMSAGVK